MTPKRILVIDDNDALLEEVANILELNGFVVDTAGNGRAALDHVRARRPDLIICDLTMPELDGYATLQAVRAQPETATLPFLVLTGREDRQDMRHGMELGADDYITKPFKVEELLRAVTAAFEKHARFERKAEQDLDHLREHVALALPHELRTPLSCIMGYAEMLADVGSEAAVPDVASLAQQIIGASQRLNRISENALLFVQLELLGGGRESVKLTREAASMTQLDAVVSAQARLKAAGHRRDSDLVLELADVVVAVSGTYVAKIVDELVDNACTFSAPGSPIRVSVAREGASGVLRVTDAGCGMSSEQIAAIGGFVQFERSVREQQGLGLGLSIATRIATVWGGSLAIESIVGTGTTVIVSLPVPEGGSIDGA
jgi:signal transduction histidine kinase